MYLSRIQLTDTFASEPELAGMLRMNSYGVHQLLWKLFDGDARHLFREENSREQLGTRRSLPLYYVLSDQRPKPGSTVFRVESKPFAPRLNAGDRLTFKLRANPTVSRREQGKKNSARHDVVMDAKYQHLAQACLEQGVVMASDLYGADDQGRKVLIQRLPKKQLQQQLFASEAYQSDDAKERFYRQQSQAVEVAAKQWLYDRAERHGFEPESLQATGYQWRTLLKAGASRHSGFSSMDYEGVLTVRDPIAFVDMLKKGLGPSKRFGCGMMMIRRA